MDDDERTIWCGNLSEKVTEELLYELFIQGGPVQKVHIPKDRDGKQKNFGFVTFKHADSVRYVLELFDGTSLFNRIVNMKSRNNSYEGMQMQQQIQQANMLLDNIWNGNKYNNQQNNMTQQVLQGNMIPSLLNPSLFMNPGSHMYPSQNLSYSQGSQNPSNQHNRNNKHQPRSHPYQRDRDSYDKHSDSHNREHKNFNRSSHRSNRNDNRRKYH